MLKVICLLGVLTTAFAGIEKEFIDWGAAACGREPRALARCLRDALNACIPRLATGIPELGVPACEPLLIPALALRRAVSALAVHVALTDVTVRGPSTMRITDLTVDFEKHEVISKLFIPELRIKGNYKLSGRLLMLPIEGEGQFSGTYGDIEGVVRIRVGRAARRGAPDALACEELGVSFSVGRAAVQLHDLCGGDGELSSTMNKFINENWQKLAEQLQAPLEEALRDALHPLAARALARLRADDLLLR